MSDRNWKQTADDSGEVYEPAFDPEEFGFELYVPKRFTGNRSKNDKDYLLASETKTGSVQVVISMCEDTSDFVRELIGETVNVYINQKGQLLIGEGNMQKLSRSKGKGCFRTRSTVAVSGLKNKIFAAHGNFRRLFLTAKPYAKGNAVIFLPSGERE